MARPLEVYLADHLAGATAGVEMFRRAAREQAAGPAGPELTRLAEEVADDRDALLAVMRAVGARHRTAKVVAGWVVERATRLKLNGSLLRRAPLSDLVELEALRLGVEGKGAGFLALRAVADRHPGLDPAELDRLVGRAHAQVEVLERLRVEAAARLL